MTIGTGALPIEITLRGKVGGFSADYAREKVWKALQVVTGPVGPVHVVLDFRRSQIAGCPASVDVVAEIDGRTVTATAVAPTMREAIDAAEPRLRRQLVDSKDRARSRTRRP